MKRILTVCAGLLLLTQFAQAQNYYEEVQEEVPPSKRVYLGGNFSFNIFGDIKFINISPLVGYRFTPRVSGGFGASYLFVEREFGFPGQPSFKISSSQYGGRLFSRYRVNETYFLHTEYESLSVELGTGVGDQTAREWVPGFFIGAGTIRPFFANSALNLTVLYNVLHDNFRSPYGSAWVIRGGIML